MTSKPSSPPSDSASAAGRPRLGVARKADAATSTRAHGLRTRFKPGGLKPTPRVSPPAEALPAAELPAQPQQSPPQSQSQPRPQTQKPPPRAAAPLVAPTEARAEAREEVRLCKLMAERGLCSRREADDFIERGWVLVEGQRVSQLGMRVAPDAHVELAPEARAQQQQRVTILLHKPVGYVSGQPEDDHPPAVALIDARSQFDADGGRRFQRSQLRGLAPAGRLDIDSTGLLVLTQNGQVARQLIGGDGQVDKEYLVRIDGRLDRRGLALLNHGLELDGHVLRPAQVEWLNDGQLRFVLREGRKRQIRRMCELVGVRVTALKRVRIGRVRLADLPVGQWRYLRDDEAF